MRKCVENEKRTFWLKLYPQLDYFCQKIHHIESAHTLNALLLLKYLGLILYTLRIDSTSESNINMCICASAHVNKCVPL